MAPGALFVPFKDVVPSSLVTVGVAGYVQYVRCYDVAPDRRIRKAADMDLI
jgi:hypothetical protein